MSHRSLERLGNVRCVIRKAGEVFEVGRVRGEGGFEGICFELDEQPGKDADWT